MSKDELLKAKQLAEAIPYAGPEAESHIAGLVKHIDNMIARALLTESQGGNFGHCPTCNSPAPHLHPAIQYEGEVGLCVDDYHLRLTASNRQEYIDAVLAKRAQRPESGGEWPHVLGVGRMFDNKKALLVSMEREPTDDELRAFHDALRAVAPKGPHRR